MRETITFPLTSSPGIRGDPALLLPEHGNKERGQVPLGAISDDEVSQASGIYYYIHTLFSMLGIPYNYTVFSLLLHLRSSLLDKRQCRILGPQAILSCDLAAPN